MDNKKCLLVGIDYSITSPAMSMYIGDLKNDMFVMENLDFFAFVDKKKIKKENEYVKINDFQWNNYIDRWNNIAYVFLGKIHETLFINNISRENVFIVIEGYSYSRGRHGMVFNIAENTVILKFHLYQNELKFKIYQPTSIKKFIIGNEEYKKGEKKIKIYDKICDKLNINLSEYLGIKESSLLYDFSDSLSILFMLYCEMLIRNNLYDKNYIFNMKEESYQYLIKKNKQGYSILDEDFVYLKG